MSIISFSSVRSSVSSSFISLFIEGYGELTFDTAASKRRFVKMLKSTGGDVSAAMRAYSSPVVEETTVPTVPAVEVEVVTVPTVSQEELGALVSHFSKGKKHRKGSVATRKMLDSAKAEDIQYGYSTETCYMNYGGYYTQFGYGKVLGFDWKQDLKTVWERFEIFEEDYYSFYNFLDENIDTLLEAYSLYERNYVKEAFFYILSLHDSSSDQSICRNFGEILLNYEEFISLRESIVILEDLYKMPVKRRVFKKFYAGMSLWECITPKGQVWVEYLLTICEYLDKCDYISYHLMNGKANIIGDIESPSAHIYSYSTNVLSLATDKKRELVEYGDEVMFGMELEASTPDCPLSALMPMLSHGIFKHDSSVDIEYVTVPKTAEEWRRVLSSLSICNSLDAYLANNGGSGVGMHVHISRKGFETDEHLYRFLYLYNAASNHSFWSIMADRELSGNQWCRFIQVYETPDEIGDESMVAIDAAVDAGRYVAINVTNSATVEVRIFKSPTQAKGVITNLELVINSYEFTKKGGWNLLDFVEEYGYEHIVIASPLPEPELVLSGGDCPEDGWDSF